MSGPIYAHLDWNLGLVSYEGQPVGQILWGPKYVTICVSVYVALTLNVCAHGLKTRLGKRLSHFSKGPTYSFQD